MFKTHHARAHAALSAAYVVMTAILLAEGALAHGACALAVALIYAVLILSA